MINDFVCFEGYVYPHFPCKEVQWPNQLIDLLARQSHFTRLHYRRKYTYLSIEDEIFSLIPLMMMIYEDVLMPFWMIFFQMKSLLNEKGYFPFDDDNASSFLWMNSLKDTSTSKWLKTYPRNASLIELGFLLSLRWWCDLDLEILLLDE